jgi:hypothetical protein
MDNKCSFVRIVGDDPTSPSQIKSMFLLVATITAVVDGATQVIIHTTHGTFTFASANPARHARNVIEVIAQNTGTDDYPETIFFAPNSSRIGDENNG